MTASLRFGCDVPGCRSTVELAFAADLRDPKKALQARSWRCESYKGAEVHLCPAHNSGTNVRAVRDGRAAETTHDE